LYLPFCSIFVVFIYLLVVPGGIGASYWLYYRKTGKKFYAHEAKKAAAAAH
jgi:hypothetical protein